MGRRTFLAAATARPLFHRGENFMPHRLGPRLLVVFLRGAYDAANILVR